MSSLWYALRGPKLYRLYKTGTTAGVNYEPNILESGADKVIGTIRFCWSFSYWTSPLLLGILYRRGHFTSEGLASISRFLATVGTMYMLAIFARGAGRFMNTDYMSFISVLVNAQKVYNAENRRLLANYDFAFWAQPVNWKWATMNSGNVKKMNIQAELRMDTWSVLTFPKDILSYVCAHTFGRRMVYPGATALINTLVEAPLCTGRAKLVEEFGGNRAKLQTEDGNDIDTMFVDRRSSSGSNGKTLVVCCEGNAGFYEIGAVETPLNLGYSVIGWNHPGFAGSTGVPFPSQEQSAIDAVMQYAIHELGFTPDNMVLYAWSIGGYTATWAAMNYPDVKFVILDATFDELMPLALVKMPDFAKGLVETTVKRYLNLNILAQILKYPGPILLIRRTRDEMITTLDPTAIHTNRGNFLLKGLLQYRYPNIVDSTSLPALEDWLSKDKSGQDLLWASLDVDQAWCEVALKSFYEAQENKTFPIQLGTDYTTQQKIHMIIFLATRHLENFDTTHCTPLQQSFFHQPWSA